MLSCSRQAENRTYRLSYNLRDRIVHLVATRHLDSRKLQLKNHWQYTRIEFVRKL